MPSDCVDIRRCQSSERVTKYFVHELYRPGTLENIFNFWLDRCGRHCSLDHLLDQWIALILDTHMQLEIQSTGFSLFPAHASLHIPFHIVPRRLLACIVTMVKHSQRSKSLFHIERLDDHTLRMHSFTFNTLLDDRADKSRFLGPLFRVCQTLTTNRLIQSMITSTLRQVAGRFDADTQRAPFVRNQLRSLMATI